MELIDGITNEKRGEVMEEGEWRQLIEGGGAKLKL